MEKLPFTEDEIRSRTTAKVFVRGQEYVEAGAVLSLKRRGNALHAQVEGSDYEPYRVAVAFDAHGIVEADCTCPYGEEWDGWCKHIVAVLLSYLDDLQAVEQQAPLDELTAHLERDQLLQLLQDLAQLDLVVYDAIYEAVTERFPNSKRSRPQESR